MPRSGPTGMVTRCVSKGVPRLRVGLRSRAGARFRLPRAAYIHVPFCRHRCGYCNFTLVAGRDDLIDDYLEAIALELGSLGGPHEVQTLFFGGGTPTHLPPPQLERLLAIARRSFVL